MAGRDFSNLTEQEKLDLYRKEISCYASKGKIPPLAQFRLDLLREDLEISAEDAQTIETEVFIPFFEYQKNLALFKEAVSKEIDDEFHISKESHEELEKLRLQIGIKLEDANRFFAENCIENPSIISSLIIRFHKFKNLTISLQGLITTKLEDLTARVFSFTRKSYNLKIGLTSLAIVFTVFTCVPAIARITSAAPKKVESAPIIKTLPSTTESILNSIRLIKSFRASDNLISSISANTQNANVVFATYNPFSWFTGKDNTVGFFKSLDYTIPNSSTLGVHQGWVNSVAFSPDGRLVGSASDDKSIKIWDVASNTEVANLIKASLDKVKSIVFSPDGSLIASSSTDKKLRFWSITNKQWSNIIYDNHFGPLAFSPDGLFIASGGNDNIINIFAVNPYERILKHSLTGHIQGVKALSFSPNGKLIASGGFDNTVKVWDVQTGREIRSFSGHTNDVNSVLFSADSKSVISGSNDGTIKIWNIDDGSVSTTQTGKKVTAIVFGRDKYNNEIIISAGMGDISVWKPQYIVPNS